jgi:hypothetical protein
LDPREARAGLAAHREPQASALSVNFSADLQEDPMDVSPQYQPIHSWRDFLLHLLTITIGLFIALTLEA